MAYNFKSFSESGTAKFINEDSHLIVEIEDGVLCIICDGVGGEMGSAKASKIGSASIKSYFINNPNQNYLDRIKESISHANGMLLETASRDTSVNKLATTAEVLFLKDHQLFWGHIGDSRIYDLKNGKITQLTKDHSLVQQMLDRGFLSVKDASLHPNKNIIMKALGEKSNIDIDTGKIILNSNDAHRFLICSDGVTAVILDDELEEILNQKNLDDCTSVIREQVIQRGAPDDYSFIILDDGN